jgi:hypothetical protein
MIWIFAAAMAYEVDFEAVKYTAGRDYWGYDTTNGVEAEAPVLTFTLDSPEILGTIDEFTIDQIDVRWIGNESAVGQLRIWRDADGDQQWSTADDLLTTLDTLSAFSDYSWTPTSGNGTVVEKVDQTFHVTAILDSTILDDPAAGPCAALWAVVDCPSGIQLSDNQGPLQDPEITCANGATELDSMVDKQNAPLVERRLGVAVEQQPPSLITAGYPATAKFAVTHCDGVPVSELTVGGPIEVVGGADTVSMSLTPDTDGVFDLSWTTPTDTFDTWSFRVGDDVDGDGEPDFIAAPGAADTVIYGPDIPVESDAFTTEANTGPWLLSDISEDQLGSVGEESSIRLQLADIDGVPVALERVDLRVVDALPGTELSTETVTTDAAGQVDFTWTLSEASGYNTAVADLVSREQSLPILRFGAPGSADGATSTTSTDITWVIANGEAPITVTVTATDTFGNRLAGVPVVLQLDGDGEVANGAGPTDAQGELISTVTSGTVGEAIVNATVDGAVLAPVRVEFRPVPQDGLYGNPWPNPIDEAGVLHVSYGLSASEEVNLGLYDTTGRLAQSAVQATEAAGYHDIEIPIDLPPGVYVLRFGSGDTRNEVGITVRGGECGCSNTTLGPWWMALILLARRRP